MISNNRNEPKTEVNGNDRTLLTRSVHSTLLKDELPVYQLCVVAHGSGFSGAWTLPQRMGDCVIRTSAASLQSMSLCETDMAVGSAVRGHCHSEWWLCQQNLSSKSAVNVTVWNWHGSGFNGAWTLPQRMGGCVIRTSAANLQSMSLCETDMAVGSVVRGHCHSEWVVVSSEPQQQVSSQCHCVKLTWQWVQRCVDTATANGWLCHQNLSSKSTVNVTVWNWHEMQRRSPAIWPLCVCVCVCVCVHAR